MEYYEERVFNAPDQSAYSYLECTQRILYVHSAYTSHSRVLCSFDGTVLYTTSCLMNVNIYKVDHSNV